MPRVLLTGFEPIAPATVNASWDAVDLLARTWDGPGEVIARRLPAVFGEAPHRLRMSIAKHIPDAVVMTAVAPGLPGIAVERIAINLDDATAPDNAGHQPVDARIAEDGPAGLWSTLPDRSIVTRLTAAGVPCGLSTSAGTFIGNHTFYLVQRELQHWGVPSGLLRLPATAEMVPDGSAATFSVEELAHALRVVVLTVMSELGDDAAHVALAALIAGEEPPVVPAEDQGAADEPSGHAPVAAWAPEAEAEPEPVTAPQPVVAMTAPVLEEEPEDVATQPFLMPISEPLYRPVDTSAPTADVPAAEAEAPAPVAHEEPATDEPAPDEDPAPDDQPEAPADTQPRPRLTWEQIIGGPS